MLQTTVGTLTLLTLLCGAGTARAATYEVDSTADTDLTACTTTADDCTLRGAINNANSNPGPDTIRFAIPGTGVQTIQLGEALPSLMGTDGDGTTIDGYTQPGSSPNTLATGNDAVVLIQVRGDSRNDGITLAANDCTVRGLSVVNCSTGISLSATTGTKVIGNIIGANASGTTAEPNDTGVYLDSTVNTTIGGTTPAERNVISGNSNVGIYIGGEQGTANKIINNYIGTTADGTAALENGYGVYIDYAPGNIIGGTTVAERNVISGNSLDGISINGSSATGNTILGNTIGTTADGASALANLHGIYLFYASGNIIGGVAEGEGNLISGNNEAGITVFSDVTDEDSPELATGNQIRGNSIYANGTTADHLGIDLVTDSSSTGATANDAGDSDFGPNGLQNYPVLTSLSRSASSTTITGSLNSKASTSYTLDFYSSPVANVSGYGEGQIYLGSATVTTNANGNVTFSPTFAGKTVPTGYVVTATATDPNGSTSEFAQALSTSVPVATSGVLISEFRTSGPSGTGDEYVELVNATQSDLNIGGWTVVYESNSEPTSTVIPQGTLIPPGGHYLLTGSAYSLSSAAASDRTLAGNIDTDTTVSLYNAAGTRVDDTGGATPAATTQNNQYAWVRPNISAGLSFSLVSVNAANGAQLGAPGPQNLASAAATSGGGITYGLVYPSASDASAPNRTRSTSAASKLLVTNATGEATNQGTMQLRRSITNNTGRDIVGFRVRVVNITSLNSPGYSNTGQADLRLMSSSDVNVLYFVGDSPHLIQGVTVDTQPTQSRGAALNSSATIPSVTLAQPLLAGQTGNYNFMYGVIRDGSFTVTLTFEPVYAP